MSTPEKLTHYLNAWNLRDPQPLAETVTSAVYTVRVDGETAVLKVLKPLGVEDEQQGAVALRWYAGEGAVRLLRADAGAHLLEYADGDDLTALVRQGQDEEAARLIAGVLNRLHGKSGPPPAGLIPLRRWFRALFRKAAADQAQGADTLFTRAAPLAEALLAAPVAPRVLHGDIHHANIRYKAGRGWLAFDPKGLYGERTYDAANTLCNPQNMPALVENEARLLRISAILAEGLRIDHARLLAFVYVYACLSASWSLQSAHEDPRAALRIAELAAPHVKKT